MKTVIRHRVRERRYCLECGLKLRLFVNQSADGFTYYNVTDCAGCGLVVSVHGDGRVGWRRRGAERWSLVPEGCLLVAEWRMA